MERWRCMFVVFGVRNEVIKAARGVLIGVQVQTCAPTREVCTYEVCKVRLHTCMVCKGSLTMWCVKV